MIRRFAKPLSLAILPLAVSGALVSCSSDDSGAPGEDAASQEALQNPPASDAPANLILDDASTPGGYTYENFSAEDDQDLSDLLGNEGTEGEEVITPPQCAPLVVDGALMFTWMMEPASSTAVASFTLDDDEDSSVIVRVTTEMSEGGLPDVAECGEFSSESNSAMWTLSQSLRAEPVDVSIDDADQLMAADVTVTALAIDGQDVGAEAVDETVRYITGTVGERTFNVVASGIVDDETAQQLAVDQVARMNSVGA